MTGDTHDYLWNKSVKPNTTVHSCFCIGPKNGQPVCPCRMRNLQVQDGRYVEVIDHGPADLRKLGRTFEDLQNEW